MRSIVFLFVGVILLGVGVLVYFSNSLPVSAFLTLLGLLFCGIGLVGYFRGAAASKQHAFIAQTGIEKEATVTFVDKNYSLLLNQKPIYTIVEYKFKDDAGVEHVRRIDNVPSDYAIRRKIEVGGTVKIKYLREDPNQSVMLV